MRKAAGVGVGLILFSLGFPMRTSSQSADPGGAAILEFKTLVGVSGPFVGTTNPVRGVPGGGLPWVVADGRGSLKANWKLEVHIKGLVLAAGSLAGTNPVSFFRAIVSCMTINGSGSPDVVNVSTDNFPADTAGDARIESDVELPSPCFAPILFVTSPGGSWFAVSGK